MPVFSTGRITKPKPKRRVHPSFQSAGRRLGDGRVLAAKKKLVSMDEDYAPEQEAQDPKAAVEDMVEAVVKQFDEDMAMEMEIVDAFGDIEIVRRARAKENGVRFGIMEENIAPNVPSISHPAPPSTSGPAQNSKRTISPCANGIFTRYDPSNPKKLRALTEAELLRKGRENACGCEACESAGLTGKMGKKGGAPIDGVEKIKVERMQMDEFGAKATRSGKSFATQGRVLGE